MTRLSSACTTSIQLALLMLAIVFLCPAQVKAQQRHILVVVGAAGEDAYGQEFQAWAQRWKTAAASAGNSCTVVGAADLQTPDQDPNHPESNDSKKINPPANSDRIQLQQAIENWHQDSTEDKQLWLVLIGHGTFDQKTAKFNLVGEDISAKELKAWLASSTDRRTKTIDQVIINCASSSGPFLNELAARNRVIVTSTESGVQFNFARFGDYLSRQIERHDIDLDKDNRTSLLELILAASNETQQFYKSENRLATESATLEDNADGLGTPLVWFEGIRAVKSAKDHQTDGLRANQVFFSPPTTPDGLTDQQRQQRDQLEIALEELRRLKSQMPEELYFQRLEALSLELARLYIGKVEKDYRR